jgi:FKBP-type peptidyl-prolyl cis-trans isomerase
VIAATSSRNLHLPYLLEKLMNRLFKIGAIAAGMILAVSLIRMTDSAEQVAPPAGQRGLTTPEQRMSYALGLSIGQDLRQDLTAQGMQVVPESLALGIVDVLRGQKPRVSQAELQTLMEQLQQRIQAAQANRDAQSQAAAQQNRQAATAFLATNKKKPGVTELPSGLQYQVLRPGTGASPSETSTVRVYYHGTLIDGTVFDSSVRRDEPIEFPLNQVIAGWTEGVSKMKVGGKWRLFIPPDLAYGDNPRPGGPIEPGMLLIFDVELLDIVN